MFSIRKALLGAALAVSATVIASAGAEAGPLPTFNIVTATGGNVTAYFVGQNAGDDDSTSVVLGASNFFYNHTSSIGDSVSLGSFTAGSEIEFSMTDWSVPATWYTGDGSRNADSDVHANITTSPACPPPRTPMPPRSPRCIPAWCSSASRTGPACSRTSTTTTSSSP